VLAAVDFHALGQVIWVSFAAGVGVTVLYSLVVFGAGKAGEARRKGESGEAAAYSALAICAMLVFAAAVVFAVSVMLNKS
jgi:hypothetical protein